MKKLLKFAVLCLGAFALTTTAGAFQKKVSTKKGPFFPCYSVDALSDTEDAVQIRIGGGTNGGFYFKGGQRLVTLMGTNQARKLPWGCVENNTGSKGNYKAVFDEIANVGFIQGNDEIELYTNPKYNGMMQGKILISLNSFEYGLLAVREGTDEDNLEDKGFKLYVGSKNSGNVDTLKHLKMLNEDMKDIKMVTFEELFGDNIIPETYFGKEILALLKEKKIDGILTMTVVSPGHKYIKSVIDEKGIEFTDLDDMSFNNKVTLNGKKTQIFEFEKVTLDFDGFDTKVTTIKTPIKLLIDKSNMNPRAYMELREALELTNFNPFSK